MKKTTSAALALTGLLAAGPALALPLNGTGLVTPDVIFGSGNANGSFTGENVGGVELGLRAKLRYNLAGMPENTFNYDGVRTYTFDSAASNAPADRSVFNFEWSINVDSSGSSGSVLSDLTYELSVDFDPSAAVSGGALDPVNVFFADNAIGDNTTPNGGGAVAADPASYAGLIGSNNVAQNSANYGFIAPVGFDPQTPGLYTIGLSASTPNGQVAATSIDVLVRGGQSVPVPAPIGLLGLAMAILLWQRRR